MNELVKNIAYCSRDFFSNKFCICNCSFTKNVVVSFCISEISLSNVLPHELCNSGYKFEDNEIEIIVNEEANKLLVFSKQCILAVVSLLDTS